MKTFSMKSVCDIFFPLNTFEVTSQSAMVYLQLLSQFIYVFAVSCTVYISICNFLHSLYMYLQLLAPFLYVIIIILF